MPQFWEDVRARELRAYFLWLDAGQPEGRDHEFWNHASDVLIFSYGSNMAALTIKRYCPDAVCCGVASLPGYQLYFPRWSESKASYVASYRQRPGEIWGVIWRIPSSQIRELDVANRYHPDRPGENSYERIRII